MKFKTLCVINAVVFGFSGLGFLFIPATVFQFYSPVSPYDPGLDVLWTGRILSAFMLTIAMLCWLARDSGPSPARRAIALSLAAGYLLNGVIHLLTIVNDAMNAYGWGVVVLFWLLAAGFWLNRETA